LTIDDKRSHLIERAAARLRQAAAPPPEADPGAGAARERAGLHSVFALAPKPDLFEGRNRPAVIETATLAKAGLIDADRQGARVVEELRIAQNNLLRYALGEPGAPAARSGNLVMITSALAKEGKSFIALNLAAGIARQAERRVLLIDTDARPGSLGRMFGLGMAPGLLDLTRGGARDLEDLAVPTACENLEFLPLGNGGGEALPRARIAERIAEIGRRYSEHLIMLDTAPCLASSDPHALAPIVGQTVFVIAAGFTQQADIEAALDLVQTCPVVSLLLNKIRSWNGHSFGSYGHPAVQG
jgi:protein-tyrosine kinase